MVGALVSIAQGLKPVDHIQSLLSQATVSEHSDPSSLAGARLAPACGLTLLDVQYDESQLRTKHRPPPPESDDNE